MIINTHKICHYPQTQLYQSQDQSNCSLNFLTARSESRIINNKIRTNKNTNILVSKHSLDMFNIKLHLIHYLEYI